MNNRKERRRAEKNLGLLKANSKKSYSAKIEIYKRKREMGKKIHEENLERIYNIQLGDENQRYIKKLEYLESVGYSTEEAKQIINKIEVNNL